MKIYLAGPVFKSEDHGEGWRRMVEERYADRDVPEFVNPVREIGHEKAKTMPPGKLVEHDKALIDRSDAVLIGYEEVVAVGTWRECEYALSVCDIPVGIWLGPCSDPKPDVSPWVLEAGYIHDELTKVVRDLRLRSDVE